MINNRQAGRRRGRGGNNSGNGNGQRQGGGGQQGNGSRIDNRSRGNAAQLYEKYKNMAADGQRAGDRVSTEYYLQFADHYFRVLSEQRGRFEDQQPRRGRDEFDGDGAGEDGEEFGEEGEPIRGKEQWNGEQQGDSQRYEARDERPRDDRPRDDRPRDDRPRDDRQRDDRPRNDGPREARPREDRPRDDRPREYRRDEEGQRTNGNGNANGGDGRREWQDRPRERAPIEVAGQRRADPLPASEPLAGRAEEVLEADRPLDAPRRRGRPRRDAAVLPAADEATDFEGGFGADRLPPSLSASLTPANDEAPAEAKPRRRRVRPDDEAPTAAE